MSLLGFTIPTFAVLPLRDIVVLPGMIAPLFVGRDKSIRALEEVVRGTNKILLLTQKSPDSNEPGPQDLYDIGVIANILQLLKLPDGTIKVLVEGQERARVTNYIEREASCMLAQVELLPSKITNAEEVEALSRTVVTEFENYVKLNKKATPEELAALGRVTDPGRLADAIAARVNLKIADKQSVLEITDVAERLERIYALMQSELNVMQTEKTIRSRVKRQMERNQKEYYLNEQMKAIQKELNEGEGKDDAADFESRIANTKLSKEAEEKAKAELKKLRQMSPMSAEANVIRTYLDWLVSIPWKKRSAERHDINRAKKVLDTDHYGMEKVKDRILEYLAVQQRMRKLKGPILCLVGPPGVGKTSLARSIAEATNRKYVRMSLGGVRDEAEIRGHRRTYIGSLPGKIIQSMKKAKTSNPLFLLDEVDKMGHDFRGDPAAALLEVLDPEQNAHFNDHYLEVDYDLSEVMFVATANSLNMPRPLLDRMEIIRLSGYTEDEKVEIAKHHLIDKLKKNHGLKKDEWSINEDALRDLVRHYTREAGVRNLERELANLMRKAVKEILSKGTKSIAVSRRNLSKYAGVPRFTIGAAEKEDLVGVTTGLAYTETGGDLLQIEAIAVPGKGGIKITGKLGDVMQESVQAAASFVRARCLDYGITPPYFQKRDMHVHVPEGATPKDGPSAGVAMCTSIVSALTGIPVRSDVAMTGEITLRGRVLPIGGLKEKLLAAVRGGIKTVLIPKENMKDLEEIPANVKKALEIIPVTMVDEVLEQALTRRPQSVEWVEVETLTLPLIETDSGDAIRTH